MIIETLRDVLAEGDEAKPSIGTIEGSTLESLSYGQLRRQVASLSGQLRAAGIHRGDRVAFVVPNGPAAAILFLAVADCAAAAPLNPNYKEDEFRFYLEDLHARALITRAGVASEAALAAMPEGVLHLELWGGPGSFHLTTAGNPLPAAPVEAPQPVDVALILHTSGTTARPKIVPLRHANLAASAQNIAHTLALSPVDRAMNVMPLFHIHGLVGVVLSTLSSGGSVVCTTGFDGFKFFDWLALAGPTWYSAVPTMHQVVLQRSGSHREVIAAHPLRLIRSSSAQLPDSVMEGMESAFGAPMVQAYGMTEGAHQLASNLPPPGTRKPGSVGPGGTVSITVLDAAGRELPPGTTGEVSVRGKSVFSGYENNPEANATAFTDGWFRTGDEGYLDEDGYVVLTGRIKEMINRGGEKVSPLEVEEVLLRHPAVLQAVVFAIPHPQLGEEVGAAVVVKPDTTVTEQDLRKFAGTSLAAFKVPRRFTFLPELPKGPTGKLQRIGLAGRLGLGPAAS